MQVIYVYYVFLFSAIFALLFKLECVLIKFYNTYDNGFVISAKRFYLL